MGVTLEELLGAVESGDTQPLYLVAGDRILAEPGAERLAARLAQVVGCEPEIHRRPADLDDLMVDLNTYSLFGGGKVLVAVETAVFADLSAAANLVDEALEVLPLSAGDGELTGPEKRSALRLLQAIRLFEVDPYAGDPTSVMAELPVTAFQGGTAYRRKSRRARPRGKAEKLRGELVPLLARAREQGLEGRADSAATLLAEIVNRGLPEGHHLVLAESSVATEHPVVSALSEKGALVRVGEIEVDRRKGFVGLETAGRELGRQTGVTADADAVRELARRTLKHASRGRSAETVDPESAGRFAAEYRKLAALAGDGRITTELVRETIEDRGQEDVWKVLDAIGAGDGGGALARIDRLMAASEDEVATRLSLFGLVAGFCRQLSALAGMLSAGAAPPGERNYHRFKSRIAPKLQAPLEDGRDNPLAGLHPFRLHRAYLAASGLSAVEMAKLPARVLETEVQMKGDSRSPDVALTALVAHLAGLRQNARKA